MAAAPDIADDQLLSAVRGGDDGAFDRLYARHSPALHRFLCRLGGRSDLADDLFQEVWLRFARHAPTLRADTNLRAWLFTVARNLHRSHVRGVVVDTALLAAIERWWYLPAAQPPPDDRLDASAALGTLRAAVDGLPLGQREVLWLVVGEDLPQDQVAAILGISHESVRQRLSRARAHLSECLAPTKGSQRWKMKSSGRG